MDAESANSLDGIALLDLGLAVFDRSLRLEYCNPAFRSLRLTEVTVRLLMDVPRARRGLPVEVSLLSLRPRRWLLRRPSALREAPSGTAFPSHAEFSTVLPLSRCRQLHGTRRSGDVR